MTVQHSHGAVFYIVRAKREWAFISLHEASGTFMASGSLGTYAHTWNAIGQDTLREFLCDLEFDYFMTKTVGLAYRQFDPEATTEHLRRLIIDARKMGAIDKLEAREAWTELSTFSESDERPYMDSLSTSKPLLRAVGHDWWEMGITSAKPECKRFWEVIWPEFIAALKAEVPA